MSKTNEQIATDCGLNDLGRRLLAGVLDGCRVEPREAMLREKATREVILFLYRRIEALEVSLEDARYQASVNKTAADMGEIVREHRDRLSDKIADLERQLVTQRAERKNLDSHVTELENDKATLVARLNDRDLIIQSLVKDKQPTTAEAVERTST